MGLFDVAVEKTELKDVIKITFASGTEKPYYIKKLGMSEKGTFIRVGTAAEPMPVKMIESLFAKRTRNSIGKIKSPNQNLTFEQLKIYYEGANKTLNQQFGSLPQGMTENEFFEGYSLPRNKELMRVFRDLDLVEHLGSGVPRILGSYRKECFKFTENFLRMTFPATEQVTPQVTPQVEEIVKILDKEMDRQDIQNKLELSDRENFRLNYLKPALEQGFIEMTIPDKPNSRLQKYRLTILGKQLKEIGKSEQ